MRSPKQVELRAKARGLKFPSEFIVSTRSGTSLVRAENARAPSLAGARSCDFFPRLSKPFQEGGDHDQV